DLPTTGFNIYRDGTRLNASPITNSTNYLDQISTNGTYTIKKVVDGVESDESKPASTWTNTYKKIQLDRPAGGRTPDNVDYDYTPYEASVGDVDGDGEYELFVKWEPSNYKDNSQEGYTGNVYIDCYKLNGTKLWRIDLGKNIRAGAHYTQFMVYDFDGDGRAEMACKTADGTIDGTGIVIGQANADYRNSKGYILSGPEFLTMFDGLTGKAVSTVDFLPARGSVSSWGDNYGNRVDRFVSAVAYLDGQKPSLIIGRGYYTRLVRVAWDFNNGELKQRWVFDSNDIGNNRYAGQGNHQMSVADVDGDGKDEIINGSSVINDDGKGLWSDGKGHGDALHVTDMDPSTPEKEIWMNHEEQARYAPYGLRLKNAKTGETIWGVETTGDIGRCMVGDIDPNYPGYEVWGATGLYSIKGELISTRKPSENFGIWWDGDLSREIYDRTRIDKWNSSTKSVNNIVTLSNVLPVSGSYTTKAVPVLSGDILGDWREEVILWGDDKSSLYLFTTPYVSNHRIHTLMHDPQYRVAIAWQNSAYNQPPYPSFFLGNNMQTPPSPNIYVVKAGTVPVKLIAFNARAEGDKVLLNWQTVSESNNEQFIVERSSDGKHFESLLYVKGAGNSNEYLSYSATDHTPLNGKSYYRLRQTDFNGNSTLSDIRMVNFFPEHQGLTITPNPVADYATIHFSGETELLDFTLIAASGQTILTGRGNVTHINQEINKVIPALKTGLYIIQLKDSDQIYSTKFIKR
ncbi:T9SS C-terminal target domain-containing protein, partial [Pseudoxanthomonas sp. SGD-10]